MPSQRREDPADPAPAAGVFDRPTVLAGSVGDDTSRTSAAMSRLVASKKRYGQ
jgi:hypothetical protein